MREFVLLDRLCTFLSFASFRNGVTVCAIFQGGGRGHQGDAKCVRVCVGGGQAIVLLDNLGARAGTACSKYGSAGALYKVAELLSFLFSLSNGRLFATPRHCPQRSICLGSSLFR